MSALASAVQQGKALYVGVSSYNSEKTAQAAHILRELHAPALIHQPSYSMLNRWIEEDHLLDRLEQEGMGCIAFTPLAQGLLTDKYLSGIPKDSRAAAQKSLPADFLNAEVMDRVRALAAIANMRGQSLAQMALAWVLRDSRVTSAVIGASRPEQIDDCVGALARLSFGRDELDKIDRYAVDSNINLWAQSSEA
jgi:L-glyceraldehyde 3-phosphate reductase